MRSRLDGILAKVQRADENITNLRNEINAFLLAHPDPYRIVNEFDNGGRDYIFKVFGDLEAPLRFSILAGEVIHHLRGSFDHLMYALVEKHAPGTYRRQQFPICNDDEKFVQASERGDMAGVSPSARELIEGAQPYKTGDAATSVFGFIRDWNNRDKHRLPLVVGAGAYLDKSIDLGPYDRPDGDTTEVCITNIVDHGLKKVSNDGVELLRICLKDPYPYFRASGKFEPQLIFDDMPLARGLPVIEVLCVMLTFTQSTIERFFGEF